jgi:glycosyltransferase involved in cell wall biosynthesis
VPPALLRSDKSPALRILYSHRVQSRDGQSVHIDELVAAFRRGGHQVLVAGPSLYQKASFGGESKLVSMARRILPAATAELAEILYNLPAFLRLWRAQKSFAPDLIYERYNLYHFAGVLQAWWRGIPLYLEVNAPLAEERERFGNLRLRRLARWLEALTWRSADRVFVVTGVLGEMVAGAGVVRDRITVTANGVGRDSFSHEGYQVAAGKPVTIGFIGFVRDWHGLDGAIAGLAAEPADPAVRLIIAGEGPARPALEAQAEALGVSDRVQFIGLQRREDVENVIRGFDIALQPRAVAYASPLKLFEYMACGRAIVAPDQPNIREILGDGETALLFDPDEPGAMWRAVRRLAADPRLREKIGRAARRALDTNDYTWEGNATRIIGAVAGDLVQRGPVARLRYGRSAPPGAQ